MPCHNCDSDSDSDSGSEEEYEDVCRDCRACRARHCDCGCGRILSFDEVVSNRTKDIRTIIEQLQEKTWRPTNKFGKAMYQAQKGQCKILQTNLKSFTKQQRETYMTEKNVIHMIMMAETPKVLRVIVEWYGEAELRSVLKETAVLCLAVCLDKSIPYICQLIMYGFDPSLEDEILDMEVFELVGRIGSKIQEKLFEYVQEHAERYFQ